MIIELSGLRAEADAGVWIAAVKAEKAAVERVDDGEVADFCARLRNYTYRSYLETMARRDETPLPRGYDNVRVFDAFSGRMLGSSWLLGSDSSDARAGLDFRVSAKRPTAASVISICLCLPLDEITAWRSTQIMPSQRPGTLDLCVDIDVRTRELLTDGTPIPQSLIDALAPKARIYGLRRPRSD